MPVTINGTTGIQDALGSAASPSLTNTTATNTGLYFPTSTTLGLATNGTAALTIDASQNVGIGTSSPSSKLNVYDATSSTFFVQGDSAVQAVIQRSISANTSPQFGLRKSRGTVASPTAVASGDSLGQILFQAYGGSNYRNIAAIFGSVDTYTSDADISGYLTFATSPPGSAVQVERMRIDSGGDLLVGTTVTTAYETNTRLKLNTSGTAQVFNQLQLVNIGSPAAVGDIVGIGFAAGETTQYGVKGSIGYVRTGDYGRGAITFYTNNTAGTASVSTSDERMRIDSSGRLLLGTTTVAGNASTFCSTAGATQQPLSFWNTATAGTRIMCTFGDSASYTERGNINWNGTTMTLATTSDRRLKTNVEPAVGGLDKVLAINVYSYDMQGGHSEFGVIAQEMIDVLPASVCVGEDNEDGSIKRPWSVGYEPMVPMLIKAVQELSAKVDAQAAEIAALKAAMT